MKRWWLKIMNILFWNHFHNKYHVHLHYDYVTYFFVSFVFCFFVFSWHNWAEWKPIKNTNYHLIVKVRNCFLWLWYFSFSETWFFFLFDKKRFHNICLTLIPHQSKVKSILNGDLIKVENNPNNLQYISKWLCLQK